LGDKRASATTCDCVKVVTEKAEGSLFQAHEVAVGATIRVVMNVADKDKVTLREWAVNG